MKNLKKTASIAGAVAIGLYFVFDFISTIINLFSMRGVEGVSILNSLGGMFKTLVLFGFMAFYLIYGIIKKNDKNDKVMNILLLVAFGLLSLSYIRGIINLFSVIFKYAKYLNKWYIAGNIINVLVYITNIAIWVLLALNVISLLTKKKMPSKIFTYVVFGLLAFSLVLELAYSVTALITGFNFRTLLILIGGILMAIFMIVFKACLGYVILENTKEIK